MEPTLLKKIDLGPDDWTEFCERSTDNYCQTLDNLFGCCNNPQMIQDLKIKLISSIENAAKYRLKELNDESKALST